MAPIGEGKCAQPISSQTVSTTLEHHSRRLEARNHLPWNSQVTNPIYASIPPHWAQDQTVACILDQWVPPREGRWQSNPDLLPLPPHHQTQCLGDISWPTFKFGFSTWEEALTISVKWKSKNPVGVEESLLHSITVVDVNVNVQHTSVMFQQLCAKIWRWLIRYRTTSRMAKTISLT